MPCSVCGAPVKARGLCMNHYAKFRRGTLKVEAETVRTFTDEDRERKYVERHPNGCWYWTGGLDGKGYGRTGKVSAHRWLYERHLGPVPAGMDLDHVCHNQDATCRGGTDCPHRRCVNPTHLRPVTRRANLAAGNGNGGVKWSPKTRCKHGHDITSSDAVYTSRNASGGVSRRCKVCAKEASHRSYRRSKV